MSQEKAQLIAPLGNMTVPGVTATGVITATSFEGNISGAASSIKQGTSITAGVVTASSFAGNLTGNIQRLADSGPNISVGVVTATSFSGNLTGSVTDLTATPDITVGIVTATRLQTAGTLTGDVTGNVTGNVSGVATGSVTGNVTGLASSIRSGANLNVGVATALEWYGDGSGLVGAGSSASVAQEITASTAETIIDLSNGNLIYLNQTAGDTTVGFASTSPAEQITIVRNPNTSGSEAWSVDFDTGGVDFDGTGDYLSIPDSNDFNYSNDPFTIEFWVNANANGQSSVLISAHTSGGLYGPVNFYMDSGVLTLYSSSGPSGSSFDIASGLEFGTLAQGVWNHVAVSRQGNGIRMFFNGVQQNDTIAFSGDMFNPTGTFQIGTRNGNSPGFNGIVSNFRIVKNSSVYNENFIPPTELTNITNTVLLCCQSTSSTTASAVTPGTITANGNPSAGSENITKSGTTPVSTYTITWPNTVKWSGMNPPSLMSNSSSGAFQIFNLTTGDTGASYQAWEEFKYDAPPMGELYTWGSNSDGILGQNNQTGYSSPIQVGSSNKWTGMSSSDVFNYAQAATKSDGTLWTWGDNNRGQLGLNENGATDRSSPIQVGTDTTWLRTDAGSDIFAAVKTDGTLWMWGRNDSGSSGVLGQNNLTSYSSPVQVGTETTWGTTAARFGCGSRNMANIKTDGSLWSWGYSDYGEGGHNNRTKYSSPKQIGTDTDWNVISVAYMSCTTIKTDGSLWGWGRARYGELPLNTGNNVHYSSPTQIGTDTNWSSVAQGNAAGSAIKTDGTLWTWGANGDGQLGVNDTTTRSSPIQVPGTTWSSSLTTAQHMTALKTDGSMWVWGKGGSGRLGLNGGDGGDNSYSSPTQVPGTWSVIGGWGLGGSGIK